MRALPVVLAAAGRLRKATCVARAFSADPRIRALVTDAYLASADGPHALASYREGRGIVTSEQHIRAALAAERGAAHIVVEGSDHAVHLRRPALVAEAIVDLAR